MSEEAVKLGGENKSRFVEKVMEILPEGGNLNLCLTCGVCSSGCPATGIDGLDPRKFLHMAALGLDDEILKSDWAWMCTMCQRCIYVCPMKIDMASIMDALRIISSKRIVLLKNGKVRKMNKAFLNSVKMFGRTYDLGMIAMFKMRTLNIFQDMDKFPTLLKKKKIALLPSFGGDRKFINRIFKTVNRIKS